MLAVLDAPIEELEETTNYSDFCHILCCHPHITLCGAWKPVPCGERLIDVMVDGMVPDKCGVCERLTCPDCARMIDENIACYRCGD